ncbi:MAG TPA: immunoglobulin domain-containing protein, partial [Planctomycetota bacterium]|nr:immunoglobulin domain-containing protein [Planctomycetota bacterium]
MTSHSFRRVAATAALLSACVFAQVSAAPGYVSPANVHRARFGDDVEGRRAYELLRAAGALARTEDYGAFRFALLDGEKMGGLAGAARLGVELADHEAVVGLNVGAFDTAWPPSVAAVYDAVPAAYRDAARSDRDALWIVQFVGPVRDAWLAALSATGASVVQYVPSNAYVTSVPAAALDAFEQFRAADPVAWSGRYEPWFKLDAELRRLPAGFEGVLPIVVQLVADGREESLERAFRAAGFQELAEPERTGGYLNLAFALPAEFLPSLAAHPSTYALEWMPVPRKQDEIQNQIIAGNLNAAGTAPSGAGYLAWLTGLGFSSVGQFAFAVDVTDDGVDRGSLTDVNDEFKDLGVGGGLSRVVYNNNYSSDALADSGDGHGNINASIVAGYNDLAGASYVDAAGYRYGLGVAPFVQIGNTKVFDNNGNGDFTGSTSTRLSAAYGGGARISSNSWAQFTAGGAPLNTYNTTAQGHDNRVRDAQTGVAGHQPLCVVFAAGNEGSGANTLTCPGTAKNVITVGATENVRQNGTDGCGYGNTSANNAQDVIAFSGRGPCHDGRKKPDVMAPGVHILGAASRSLSYDGGGVCDQYEPAGQTLYCQSTGTSHSTPAVAGAAALVRQHFLNLGLPAPSPAMTKATLMGATRYLTGVAGSDTLPSNTQGAGLVDLGRAFDGAFKMRVDQTTVLASTGATHVTTGNVGSATLPFRVALAWTDAAGGTTGNAWVNNLDLSVTVGGQTYKGNVLTGALSTTGGTADTQNNVELVFLPAGTTGAFTVTVTATNIAGDGVPGNGDSTDQDFALFIYNGSSCAPPTFTAHPSNQTPCTGGPLTLTAAATAGTGSVSYQWRRDGADIPGAVSATYAVGSASAGDAGTYVCVATDGCASTTSNAATVTVSTAPAIGVHPASQTVCSGTNVTFTVVASGTAPSYQWRKGGSNLAGATSASYAINGVTTGAAGNYDCVVSNGCGSATSNVAVLTVNAAPSITAQPTPQSVCLGAQASFSVTAAGTPPLTYQWRKGAANIAGATAATYVIPSTGSGDAGTYSCVVTNGCTSTTSNGAALTVSSAPAILTNPASQTVCSGGFVIMSVSASGAGLTYQWRKDGATLAGAVASGYVATGLTPASSGVYDCVVTNGCGSATSAGATLTVNGVPTVTSQPQPQSACPGGSASFTVVASGSTNYAYQWRKNGSNVGGATAATYVIPVVAAGDAASYDCVITTTCGSTTSAAAALTLDGPPVVTTHPASAAPCAGQPAVFVAGATGAGPLGYQWRKDGVDVPGATASTLAFAATVGGDSGAYDCVVSNGCGATPTAAATLAVQTAPTLTSISPDIVAVQAPAAPDTSVTVQGACFTPGSLAVANGVALATTFV